MSRKSAALHVPPFSATCARAVAELVRVSAALEASGACEEGDTILRAAENILNSLLSTQIRREAEGGTPSSLERFIDEDVAPPCRDCGANMEGPTEWSMEGTFRCPQCTAVVTVEDAIAASGV